MCGIFGAIGNANPGTIRALALINRERGMDSLGFFDSKGHVKRAGDPLDLLAEPEFQEFHRPRLLQVVVYRGAHAHGNSRRGHRLQCAPLPLWPIHRHAQWGGVDSEGPQVSSGFAISD